MHATFISLDKRFTLMEAERRLKKACDHIELLNQVREDVEKRFKMAKRNKSKVLRTRLRRQLRILERACKMYNKYAHKKAELVAELSAELYG